MSMPNMLIIGRSLCGCTALARVLSQHAEIFMSPVPEPSFFALEGSAPQFDGPGDARWSRNLVYRLGDYQALFKNVTTETVVGEVSTMYTNWYKVEQTAENIRRHVPRARLIVILRRPAERAWAAFLSRQQQGREPLADFAQALAAEYSPERANWSPACRYFQNGLYYKLLRPYYERFSREQIHIGLYEESQTRPQKFIRDILGFLHVKETESLQGALGNQPYCPRSRALQSVLCRPHPLKAILKRVLPRTIRAWTAASLRALNRSRSLPLDPELDKQLTQRYRQDTLKLQELVGCDLGEWL